MVLMILPYMIYPTKMSLY